MELKNEFYPLKGFENTHLINPITQEVYSLIKNKVLKGSIISGYKSYNLKISVSEKAKWKKLHRLIAETFIPNPNNYSIVNHINGNKLDNRIENLEWCTSSHNNIEAYRLGLKKVSQKTKEQFKRNCLTFENIERAKENLKKSRQKAIQNSKLARSKKVCIYNDNFYKEFESEIDACNFLNVHKGSVGRVANSNGKYKIKGFKAKYKI